MSDIIDQYLDLSDEIYTFKLDDEQLVPTDELLEKCKQAFRFLPDFVIEWRKEFGDMSFSTPCLDILCQYFLKKLDFSEAKHYARIADECQISEANNLLVLIDHTEKTHLYIQEKASEYPGVTVSMIIEELPDIPREVIEMYINSDAVKKIPDKQEYKIYLKDQNILLEKDSDEIELPSWYISVSFSPSSSKRFAQVMELASSQPLFYEKRSEYGDITYQIFYTYELSDLYAFLDLFSIVKDWKSTGFTINDKFFETKIIEELVQCYIQAFETASSSYCFGTGDLKNPFGCHRLGLNDGNDPWWKYGKFDSGDVWHVDKRQILKKLKEGARKYHQCPFFVWENITDIYKALPDTIDTTTDQNWIRSGYTLQPRKP